MPCLDFFMVVSFSFHSCKCVFFIVSCKHQIFAAEKNPFIFTNIAQVSISVLELLFPN